MLPALVPFRVNILIARGAPPTEHRIKTEEGLSLQKRLEATLEFFMTLNDGTRRKLIALPLNTPIMGYVTDKAALTTE
ncbi:hypothetical protein WG66_003177 [Moniliophthora roreri]|nr:hypothetical protein WG66_003171 [Moniliophthora roreri]KAI3597603.1 hypothetical protein WG66_003177 [Moniliophthora roreri]